jgi:hypothetical protein
VVKHAETFRVTLLHPLAVLILTQFFKAMLCASEDEKAAAAPAQLDKLKDLKLDEPFFVVAAEIQAHMNDLAANVEELAKPCD